MKKTPGWGCHFTNGFSDQLQFSRGLFEAPMEALTGEAVAHGTTHSPVKVTVNQTRQRFSRW
jgi:hypothetical protein